MTDDVLEALARGVTGKLGGKVGVAPRIFLKKLVPGILDRVDLYETFEPTKDFKLVVEANELTAEERDASGDERSVDDIELELADSNKDET